MTSSIGQTIQYPCLMWSKSRHELTTFSNDAGQLQLTSEIMAASDTQLGRAICDRVALPVRISVAAFALRLRGKFVYVGIPGRYTVPPKPESITEEVSYDLPNLE